MKKIMLLFMLIPCLSFAQLNGKVFPDMEVENLNGEKIMLPKTQNDKPVLIGIAISKKAEDDWNSWLEPLYQKFIQKSGMFDDDLNVDCLFVPMFTGIKKMASGKVSVNTKNKIDPKLEKYILIYSGKMGEYDEILKLDEKDAAYLFLLDKTGKIIYHTKGEFSEQKMEKLEDLISAQN